MTPASPTTSPAASAPQPSLTGQTERHYNSAYLIIENFVFNPTLVTGFLHRAATGDESVAVTEVLYGSHHLIVEDREQHLFHHLCKHVSPNRPKTKT